MLVAFFSALLLWDAYAVKPEIPDPPCSCSSGFIPVPVDVTIPVDPSVPEGLNSTNTFRLRTTFEVFGVLCQPISENPRSSHAIQLLMHGQTYNTQYWDVTWGGFQNYSYIGYSCSRGISSFAYDNLGNGRTVRPVNSTHCQLPVAAQVASSISRDLKNGRISRILTGRGTRYKKVVGIGHSMGSATLNYAAISEGSRAPFDGLILTGSMHDTQFTTQPPVPRLPASEVNPSRWAGLDPGYITTVNITGRSLYYGPEGSFSPTMLQLDELTKDAGSAWISAQIIFIYSPAIGFPAPVVEIVGAMDKLHCPVAEGMSCDQETLQVSEAQYFPDSKNFTAIVVGGGHDINYGYAAAEEFGIMNHFFLNFVQ